MSTIHLKLYADAELASPYVMSVAVSLAEKQLPYSLELVNLEASDNESPAYRSMSLTGRVPTLLDGNFALSESSAIAEYLEERYAPPAFPALYPLDIAERARARQIQAWLRSDFGPIRLERNTTVIFFGAKMPPLSSAARAAAAKLFDAADQLIPATGDKLFSNWSIADTDLAIMLSRLVLHGDDVPEKLVLYARVQWQRPAVVEWLARARTQFRALG